MQAETRWLLRLWHGKFVPEYFESEKSPEQEFLLKQTLTLLEQVLVLLEQARSLL